MSLEEQINTRFNKLQLLLELCLESQAQLGQLIVKSRGEEKKE